MYRLEMDDFNQQSLTVIEKEINQFIELFHLSQFRHQSLMFFKIYLKR